MILTTRIIDQLSQLALFLNKKHCQSRAISDSFYVLWSKGSQGLKIEVISPYYWAKYYKNGVDVVRYPKNSPYLIWFKDPDDDPRISPRPYGYPVTREDVRHLSKNEFIRYRNEGKLIFAKSAGTIPPHDWTDQAFPEFRKRSRVILKEATRKEILKTLKPLQGIKKLGS